MIAYVFKSILKISHSKYLKFRSSLPMKFPIFLKSSPLFDGFFSVYKQNFTAQWLKN